MIVIIQENLDIAQKEKHCEINWISSNSSAKQRHKDFFKAIIVQTQQNNRCILCGDGDGTINPIKSECNKQVQKEFKTRNDWVGKVISWELSKKLKFKHITKWICTNQKPSGWMKRTIFFGILRYDQIT